MNGAPDLITRAIDASAFLRRGRSHLRSTTSHKEWFHFAVHGDGVSVLVNFSLVESTPAGGRAKRVDHRVLCVVRGDSCEGDVDSIGEGLAWAPGGGCRLEYGDSRLAFEDGRFEVRVRLPRRQIHVDLSIVPGALPTQSSNAVFEDGPPMSWVVVPRLSATGTVSVGGRVHHLVDAPAYHDHNWGSFRFGTGVRWEWGYAVPPSAQSDWSAVFTRFLSSNRSTTLAQGLLLWRGERQERLFRGHELSIERVGRIGRHRPLCLPRALGLVDDGSATDVPSSFAVEARGRGDRVRYTFDAEDVVRLLVPNDSDLGVTRINEVFGRATLEGSVRGTSFHACSPATFEFLE